MIIVKITCNTGKTWTTRFNGTFPEAKARYLGTTFTDETDGGVETRYTCTDIRLKSSDTPLETFSPDWFDYTFQDVNGLTSQLRSMSERMCREFNIKGICDPLYVAKIVAFELGIGDGCSNFTGATVVADTIGIDKRIDKLVNRFAMHEVALTCST